ncbi:hypothetical protein ACHQM5_021223 [Ranunculus cassubicifolius]
MEGNTDTVELPRSKKMKIGSTPKDNIGVLPEAILHHILSFLDMKEVLQTSFLSRRWRYTWKSVQVMNFDYSLWEPEEKSSSSSQNKKKKKIIRPYVKRVLSKEGCMNFLDRVIYVFRDPTTNIQKLKLSEHYCHDRGRLDTLLLYVLPNIKEVHLESNGDKYLYELPCSLFTSEKLEVFVLAHKIAKYICPVVLPATMCSNCRLTTLSLQCCLLPHGDSNHELVLKNPVLKKLALINCDHHELKVVNIIAPQLKELEVKNCLGDGDYDYGDYDYTERVCFCEIKLCTPSLLLLRFDGQPYLDFSLGDLSSLITADIWFDHWLEESQLPLNFLRCLHRLSNVSALKLHPASSESNNPLHEPLSSFRNLRHLTLGRVSCIPSVTKVLQSSPFVETLVLRGIDTVTIFEEKYWRKELPMQDRFHHLRCFKIAGCLHFHENELKLLTFMLKNSMALENIAITYMASEGQAEEVTEFKHKLLTLLEAYSKVTIHFDEHKDG